MRQMMLAQKGETGRVIVWTNFSHWQVTHGFCQFLLDLSSTCFASFSGC